MKGPEENDRPRPASADACAPVLYRGSTWAEVAEIASRAMP